MNWHRSGGLENALGRFGIVAFGVFGAMLLAVFLCDAQVLRKGVHVEMAVTTNATAMPDADEQDAWVLAITEDGRLYFGIRPTTPAALASEIKSGLANRPDGKLYVKADARTLYANVMKVLEAARAAGIAMPSLLTSQQETVKPGTMVPPKGVEVTVVPANSAHAELVVVLALSPEQGEPEAKINNHVVPLASLESRLSRVLQNGNQQAVRMEAAGELPYGSVVRAIDACRSAGAQVSLVEPRA